jgi:photosystem II stability/assembly factor-like uncharacterized protein
MFLGALAVGASVAASVAMAAEVAAPVGNALDRAAVVVRSPERAVLLGAAAAGARVVAVGERGIVVLSDDAGRTWRQAAVPTSVTLTAVRFADAKHGWAVGHGGVVLATEDGGQRWTRRLDGRRAAQLLLDAARAAGDTKAIAEAERLVAEGADKPLFDVLLMGGKRLLVVGAYGLALASDDGGASWSVWTARLPNPKAQHLYAARQRGDTVLIAGEQGLALLSSDGGRSFRALATPYKGSFFACELPSDGRIVLAGLRGTVLESGDAGVHWDTIATPMQASVTATALDADGQLVAVNQAGFVLALRGSSLVPLNAAPLPPLNGLLMHAGATLALSIQGVLPVPAKP